MEFVSSRYHLIQSAKLSHAVLTVNHFLVHASLLRADCEAIRILRDTPHRIREEGRLIRQSSSPASRKVLFGTRYVSTILRATNSALSTTFGEDRMRILPTFCGNDSGDLLESIHVE